MSTPERRADHEKISARIKTQDEAEHTPVPQAIDHHEESWPPEELGGEG